MPSKSKLPRWDLTDLYRSIKDPRLEQDADRAEREAEAFAARYRGKIDAGISPEKLCAAIREYEAILQNLDKPETYAHLVHAADSLIPAHGKLLNETKTRTVRTYNKLVFFDLAILALPAARLEELARDTQLVPYRHYLEVLHQSQPHRLSEVEEQLSNDKYLTGRAAFIRLYDERFASRCYPYKHGKTTQPLTETEVLHLLQESDRATRKNAAAAFTAGLREETPEASYIFNVLAQDKLSEDRRRNFARPESARHLSNEITPEAVDALTQVVTKNYRLFQNYFRFKRDALGLKELYEYDRYAPVTKNKKSLRFDEAKELVLGAYERFSPAFATDARNFFDQRWIDAEPRRGKRGGAFCMFATPDLHPYVFVNYQGNLKDALTLAHELGHGVHACRSRAQTYLNFNTPLTVAETASVFGEMLVFDVLCESKLSDRERLALYMQKLDDILATVFRQISMFKFEREVFDAIGKRGEQTPEEIAKIWRKTQAESFGDAVTLTPDYDLWWNYIHHFFHSPFYVYAYAFGELLTLALFAQYKKDGASMTPKYLDMLSTGGSKSPDELVKPFGINLTEPTFWQRGVNLIEELFAETKRLRSRRDA